MFLFVAVLSIHASAQPSERVQCSVADSSILFSAPLSFAARPSGGERAREAAEAGGDRCTRRLGRQTRGDGGGHATGVTERIV